MIPLDTLLALVLIVTPDCPIPENPSVPLPVFQSVGIHLELLDARERRWAFVEPNSFKSDLTTLRQRCIDLSDAPSVLDSWRFPARELCSESCSYNRAYRSWLVERRQLFPTEEWIGEAMLECDHLWAVWDAAKDAQCEYYYVSTRRESLKNLRQLVGVQAYYAGCLPGPIPAWRLRRVDD